MDALGEAIALVRGRLFPIRLERWLALGFVAFLDGCGRGAASGGFQFPGGPGGGGAPVEGDFDATLVRDWLADYMVVIAAAVVLVAFLFFALTVLILWLQSRGTFMYLDNVASGRFDVVRPWREHSERAWSYFLWKLGVTVATMVMGLLLLAPGAWAVYSLVTHGASFGAIALLGLLVLLLLVLAVAVALFSLLLRDFAAPLQWRLGVPCGEALGVAWALVKTYPGPFLGYFGLKIVFSVVFGIVSLLAGCLTCCIGFLPVVSHTLLQPLHYLERSWSLLLLRHSGHDLFPADALLPSIPRPPAS